MLFATSPYNDHLVCGIYDYYDVIVSQSCNVTQKTQANDSGDKEIHAVPPEADFAYLGTEVPGNNDSPHSYLYKQ